MPKGSGNTDTWVESDCAVWRGLLDAYPDTILAHGSDKLANLDHWFRGELPRAITGREQPCIYLDELQGVAAWKMSRGVWRERNRVLIGGNPPDLVVETSSKAFAAVPDPKAPITILSALAGVGPATASAVMAAFAPGIYPFFDEAVAGQIPDLGPVTFTTKYYLAYAEALRARATDLNTDCSDAMFTPHDLAQALWVSGRRPASFADSTDGKRLAISGSL